MKAASTYCRAKVLRQITASLGFVARRHRLLRGDQRHRGDPVIGRDAHDIGHALLAVFRFHRVEGRIADFLVAIDLREEIVDQRFVVFHLGRTPAGRDVGADGRIEPALHRVGIMRAPDIGAVPIPRGDENRKLDQARLEARAPAQIVRHIGRVQTEFRAAEIYSERSRIVDVAVARRLLHLFRELLLPRCEIRGIDHRIAGAAILHRRLCDRELRQSEGGGDDGDLQKMLHCVLPDRQRMRMT